MKEVRPWSTGPLLSELLCLSGPRAQYIVPAASTRPLDAGKGLAPEYPPACSPPSELGVEVVVELTYFLNSIIGKSAVQLVLRTTQTGGKTFTSESENLGQSPSIITHWPETSHL